MVSNLFCQNLYNNIYEMLHIYFIYMYNIYVCIYTIYIHIFHFVSISTMQKSIYTFILTTLMLIIHALKYRAHHLHIGFYVNILVCKYVELF